MTLPFPHWTYRKRHYVNIRDTSLYQCSDCISARLMTSDVNIYFFRRPLQSSPLVNVAVMIHFLLYRIEISFPYLCNIAD